MLKSTPMNRSGTSLILGRNHTYLCDVFGSGSAAVRNFTELFREESRGRRVNLNYLRSNLHVVTKLASVMALHSFDGKTAVAIPETASSILFFNRQAAYTTLKGSRQASTNGKIRDLLSYLNNSASGFVVAAKEDMASKGLYDLSAKFNNMIMEFAISPTNKDIGSEIARLLRKHGGMDQHNIAYEILKEPVRFGAIADRLMNGKEDPLAHLLSAGMLSRAYGIGNANGAAMRIASTTALYGFSVEQTKLLLSTYIDVLRHSSHDLAERARRADSYLSLAHNGFFVAALKATAAHDTELSLRLHRQLASFGSHDDSIEMAAMITGMARAERYEDISTLLTANGARALLRH
ncbi:MAG: hypothetical protein KGI00_02975 [Candidatus Micrarchaeota archaeon]|nr:hypothetical protein [Candidatus Micrarchaeota archaeon]MDE1824203.1 hypothetical protein [Candidatus Micrarchaeota archaeon]MDE1849670.1 hypothetical protein [Candidatus Micrarchaeota archaeon]